MISAIFRLWSLQVLESNFKHSTSRLQKHNDHILKNLIEMSPIKSTEYMAYLKKNSDI